MVRLLLEQPAAGLSGQILVRTRLRAVAQRIGFSALQREQLELICTELITNQAKYAAGSGLIQIWEWCGEPAAIDLFALDYGPGIPDLANALADGYTTAHTLGRGLGAISRLAHESGIYSLPQRPGVADAWHGVAIWARFYLRPRQRQPFQIGLMLRAYGDGPHNGDLIWPLAEQGRLRWIHADGLGHGAPAAQAVASLPTLLTSDLSLPALLARMSQALQGGRGAVAMVAELDPLAGRLQVCGVGDLAGAVISGEGRLMFNFPPGVLGHQHRSFHPQQFSVAPGALLVTSSDGLRRSWDDMQLPGLSALHPQLVAYVLGNLLARVGDDKSVCVVRMPANTQAAG